MTDFDAALDEAVRATGTERYRWLCSDENDLPAPNDRETWRAWIVAGGWRPSAPAYPSLTEQAGNALGALGRAIGAAATGQAVMVDVAEAKRRLAICRGCEHFDEMEGRCRQCGCVAAWKARLATEHCPLDPPKW